MDSGYYPTYIPGETAYSWIARYHLARPYSSWKITNKNLFGKEYVRVHPILPGHLIEVAHHAQVSVDELIREGSGYSLFAYTQNCIEWADRLKECMLNDKSEKISFAANISSSKLPFRSIFKYCPHCVEADIKSYGAPIWHTNHQFYGVWACPTHETYLLNLPYGDGGVNHSLILPELTGAPRVGTAPGQIVYMAQILTSLHQILNKFGAPAQIFMRYEELLSDRGYVTPRGHLRSKILRNDLTQFWCELFEAPCLSSFHSIRDFHYVPDFFHQKKRIHYFKQALLIGFLTNNINRFFIFNTKKPEQSSSPKNVKSNTSEINEDCLKHLRQGKTLRAISRLCGKSVGFLKQLALKNSIPVLRRRQTLTAAIERSILRQAFMGIHRSLIASNHNCSVGSVEIIIQCHKGLSTWRAHLRNVNYIRIARNTIQTYLNEHKKASRHEIQKACRGAYTKLFKCDKDWLYNTLPAQVKPKFTSSIDWPARDKELRNVIRHEILSGRSLSDIDRQLGHYYWLIKYREKLPLSVAEAILVIENTRRRK